MFSHAEEIDSLEKNVEKVQHEYASWIEIGRKKRVKFTSCTLNIVFPSDAQKYSVHLKMLNAS